MKIEIIDFGAAERGHLPKRIHANDCGADVFAPYKWSLRPGDTIKLPLGFGIKIPAGYGGFIYPRGSMAKNGINCALNPIDPSYIGEIHATLTNCGRKALTFEAGDRIGQLVILPCTIADFVPEPLEERGDNGFGSTGK